MDMNDSIITFIFELNSSMPEMADAHIFKLYPQRETSSVDIAMWVYIITMYIIFSLFNYYFN